MKILFLWLILSLSLFCKTGFAAPNESSISAINEDNFLHKEQHHSIDKKLLMLDYPISTSSLIDKIEINNGNIKKNSAIIKNFNKELKFTREITNSNHIGILKSIKAAQQNKASIKESKDSISSTESILSEHIISSEKYEAEIERINNKLNNLNKSTGLTNDYLDRFWILIAAALVFFMQAGFKTFEAGMVRKQHEDNVAIKNLLDWLIISLAYFLVGFGFMFGDSYNGLIGTNLFSPTSQVLENIKETIVGQYLGLEFFLYQLAFAATAATIVSGALSERVALIPYIVLSMFIGVAIYPVFGHWAWGGTYFQNDQGWLYTIGFRDFAGSTVVHSIGAWVALAGVIVIGARNGRYDKDGNLNTKDFLPSNLGYSALGVLILWFGWWGFNGGSQLKYDENIASIIVNTTLSGSAAGLTAFFQALSNSRDKYEIFPKLLGGILGGLVAITACCNSVSSGEALFIGAIAGLVHNYSHDFLIRNLKLDDPVGAIAVHGFCGVWGTLCVAFFGQLDSSFFSQNNDILFSEHRLLGFLEESNIRIKQTIIQLIGIITAFSFTFSLSYLFFNLIRKIPGIGLRVIPSDEKKGSILGISY